MLTILASLKLLYQHASLQTTTIQKLETYGSHNTGIIYSLLHAVGLPTTTRLKSTFLKLAKLLRTGQNLQ
ncbi:hypothetical protein C484_18087 [Natrialba taiwanensis DSM 12281]|uniref:Uncharacterized protein n=1 Tax=Natrialba taiwanensis DSM 12281 TaxID=1230458 RepID=L9ZJI1_9EURY|nr:hypothetical protein C484_18087 [Natrialba taiwanensis DSM 12281]